MVRAARDSDSEQLIRLIGSVFAEYEGCVLDVDGELPELRAPETHFRRKHGKLWVADVDDTVVGSLGLVPAHDAAGVELQKVYVLKHHRRLGIARRLYERAYAEALSRRARFIELWTDTRFESGHRFYEGMGFLRSHRTRELHDLSHSVEYHYRLELPLA
jgi:putative acetyltransferase